MDAGKCDGSPTVLELDTAWLLQHVILKKHKLILCLKNTSEWNCFESTFRKIVFVRNKTVQTFSGIE